LTFKKNFTKTKKNFDRFLTTTAWRTAPKRRGLWAGLAEKVLPGLWRRNSLDFGGTLAADGGTAWREWAKRF